MKFQFLNLDLLKHHRVAKIQVLQFDCKNFRFLAQPSFSTPFFRRHATRTWSTVNTGANTTRVNRTWNRPHTLHATRREIKYAPVIQDTPLSILSHRYKILRAMFLRKHPSIGENRSYSGECWYNRGGHKFWREKLLRKNLYF